MNRGKKSLRSVAEAKRPAATRSLKDERHVRDLERRLQAALEQQTATSEILRVISSFPADTTPVFDAIAERAAQLCDAHQGFVFTYDGQWITIGSSFGVDPKGTRAVADHFPMQPAGHSVASRTVSTGTVVNVADVIADPDYALPDAAKVANYRGVLGVPMRRENQIIGAITVTRREAGPFSGEQIDLLTTFADQAVIAIENVRLFKETNERLEQQTATSEILRVISQSPTDVQPVFDTIATAALKLCRASSVNVFTFDGELIRIAAQAGVSPEGGSALRRAYPKPPGRDTAVTRAILTCSVAAIPDVLRDTEYRIQTAAVAGGFRSVLSVPLLREGLPIGGIAVGRPEPGPFPDKQIALLKTFADQAVIAIENVRLFNELQGRNRDLSEALEQQTATAEILDVISRSPTDVQPVFEAIAQRAAILSGAKFSYVTTFDGEWIQLRATYGPGTQDHYAHYPIRPGTGAVAARVVRDRAPVQIPDVLADTDYAQKDSARTTGYRSAAGVPMLREGNVVGAIAVARPDPGVVPDKIIRLLQTFADQAAIAIEDVRLFKELEARTEQLTRSVKELKALGEVGQAVSSTLDLDTVLSTIVSRARSLTGMEGCAIYEYDEAREAFYLRATDGLPDELVEVLRAAPTPKGEGAVGRLAITGEPVQIPDIVDERAYQSRLREILIRLRYRSLLAVPLLRECHLLGGLVVNRTEVGTFAPEAIGLLKTFATQSALAIQNARFYRELEAKSRELDAASRHKSEFLANMSHELRTPLNAIIGFSQVLSERMFGEINDKQAEYIADILQSGEHLLSLINDILDLSKIEAGRMELELSDFDLPHTIDNTLLLVRERAQRRGITLMRSIDKRLGVIRADERKVKQVVLNLLSNAMKFTPEGGRIDVQAAIRDGTAQISVSDTGVGIAPEDQQAVFEEFRQVGMASKKVEGTGLGLAISRKFVELHGGTIWVESKVGSGSTFAFTLPVR